MKRSIFTSLMSGLLPFFKNHHVGMSQSRKAFSSVTSAYKAKRKKKNKADKQARRLNVRRCR